MREHWLNPRRSAYYPRIFLACYIAAEIALTAISHHGIDPSSHPIGRDFIGFWSASKLVLAGTPAPVCAQSQPLRELKGAP
ncbi:MAG: hypothetical protein OSA97_13245 [Nevskia sp.]|nr:hypothetical protein [Nevskia sp.]